MRELDNEQNVQCPNSPRCFFYSLKISIGVERYTAPVDPCISLSFLRMQSNFSPLFSNVPETDEDFYSRKRKLPCQTGNSYETR